MAQYEGFMVVNLVCGCEPLLKVFLARFQLIDLKLTLPNTQPLSIQGLKTLKETLNTVKKVTEKILTFD